MKINQFPTFENFREDIKTNEAMVQIAGRDKPAGAKVLATVLVNYMILNNIIERGYTTPSMKKDLIEDVSTFIMDNTF